MRLPPQNSQPNPSNIFRHTTFETLFHVSKMDPSSQTHCVLLLDLPPQALGGIDLLSFTTAPRFRGIKNVPPGLHFVFAASDSSLAVRHGAWFYVSPGSGPPQVFVKKWDAQKEELIQEASKTEVMRLRANLGSVWKDGMTPYRQTVKSGDTGEDDDTSEESTDWGELISRVSPTLLSRICGLNPDHWGLNSASSAAQDLETIPGLESSDSILQPERELRFLPVNLKRTWREGATGRERTEAAQDRSWALGELIESHFEGGRKSAGYEILGELQFTFLMVLTLNNNSCLEQWKRILGLLLTCREAVKDRHHLFLELLKVLRLQLSHLGDMEVGLFDLNEQGGGFLRPLLKRFRKSLDEFDGKWKSNMVDEFDELQEFLEKEFGWELDDSYVKRGMLELEDGERVEMDMNGADEDDEAGEFAPTIVELTPEQAKELNGSDTGSADDSEDDADLEDMDTRY
jgi:A1 cistron-splicing factor AAR2